jgi:hypothetical protein
LPEFWCETATIFSVGQIFLLFGQKFSGFKNDNAPASVLAGALLSGVSPTRISKPHRVFQAG